MQPLLFVLTLWNPHHEILVKWGTIYIGTNFLNWLSFWSYVRGYAHPQKWTISNFCCRTFYRSDALLVSSHSTKSKLWMLLFRFFISMEVRPISLVLRKLYWLQRPEWILTDLSGLVHLARDSRIWGPSHADGLKSHAFMNDHVLFSV